MWKSHISQWGASSGLGKHKAAGELFPCSEDAPSLVMCDFHMDMGSCFYPMTCKKSPTQPSRNHEFPLIYFLHELCRFHGGMGDHSMLKNGTPCLWKIQAHLTPSDLHRDFMKPTTEWNPFVNLKPRKILSSYWPGFTAFDLVESQQ